MIFLNEDKSAIHAPYNEKYQKGNYGLDLPPWDRDLGDTVVGSKWGTSAHNAWNISEVEECRVQQQAANFYILDGISSHIILRTPTHAMNPVPSSTIDAFVDMLDDTEEWVAPPCDTLEGIQANAIRMLADLLRKVTPVMHNYIHYAISSELYFHSAVANLGKSWDDQAVSWNAMVKKYGSGQCGIWAAEVFRDDGWSSSYGGEPWAQGGDVLSYFADGELLGQHFGRKEFLDRCFSLEHNNGTYLNKANWAGGTNGIKTILDAHHESNWYLLFKRCSEGVLSLAETYWNECNSLRSNAGVATVPFPTSKKTAVKKKKMTAPGHQTESASSNVLAKPAGKVGVKKMVSKFPGKCCTSGNLFPAGTVIMWHGVGEGASILEMWNAATGPSSTPEMLAVGDVVAFTYITSGFNKGLQPFLDKTGVVTWVGKPNSEGNYNVLVQHHHGIVWPINETMWINNSLQLVKPVKDTNK